MPFSLPTNIRVVLVCAIRRSCCLNRVSTAPRYFSESLLAMQRARIEAAAALMSSGNSRNTKRTLPVSIYLDRSIGNTFSPNAAQCEQLIDAYSVMVTGAFGDPIAMSGSDTGLATAAAIALWATAARAKNGAVEASRATMAMRWRGFNGLFQFDDRGRS